MMMLENEQRLHCDWNSTTFCVTDLAFNESVRQEIEKLHFNIESTFAQKFPDMKDADIAQQIAEKLEGLDP